MSRNTNQAKALIDAWFILLRYKWRFVFPLFIVSSTILALSLLLPRKYQAEAVFDRRTDQILASIMVGGAAKSYGKHNASIRHELSSGLALDKAIEDIRPYVQARVKAGGNDVDLVALRQDMAHKTQVKFEISTPEKYLERTHETLYNYKKMPREYDFPLREKSEMEKLKHPSLAAAKEKMLEARDGYLAYFKENDEARTKNVVFGDLNRFEWYLMERKHLNHHFEQFNLL